MAEENPSRRSVPRVSMDELADTIERAEEAIREYEAGLGRDASHARISLGDLPHALVPTSVIGRDLVRMLEDVVGPEAGPAVMYNLGKRIGRAQASAFFARAERDESDPAFRVLAGPFHFAWAGYGSVELLVWQPHLDERFALLWQSDASFSAEEALSEPRHKRACHLQAGYSAGWCREATQLPLEAAELACRAEGLTRCRFVISHAERIERNLADPRFHRATKDYRVIPLRPRLSPSIATPSG
jgi:predicted hydrocarbon binding protein